MVAFMGGIQPVLVIFRCLVGLQRKANCRKSFVEDGRQHPGCVTAPSQEGREMGIRAPLVEISSISDLTLW